MTNAPATAHPVAISIIVPVYNVEAYVAECLQSIVDQKCGFAIEALLVEDCSSDHSKQICQEFVEHYPQLFRLIANAENRGVSVARNTGLDNCSGDYFMFVDPDDALPAQALQDLYTAASRHDADIVKGNNTIFNERHETNAAYNTRKQTMIRGDEVLTTLYQHQRVRGHPWGKLFNRSRLGKLRFPVGVRMAQDLYYCGEVFSQATSLLLIASPVYRYRNRDSGSTGRKFETGAYLDWLGSVEKIGGFAHSQRQHNAHRSLQLRTLTQIARECRNIPPASAARVLETIDEKCHAWNIRLAQIFSAGGGLRTLGRYLKLQSALRQIRRNLANTR
jgi:hypothetical protein